VYLDRGRLAAVRAQNARRVFRRAQQPQRPYVRIAFWRSVRKASPRSASIRNPRAGNARPRRSAPRAFLHSQSVPARGSVRKTFPRAAPFAKRPRAPRLPV